MRRAVALLSLLLSTPALAGVPPVAPAATRRSRPPRHLSAELLANLQWRNIGPAIASGRVIDIAVDPRDHDVVYVASAAGGLFKSVDHGTTWRPVFERERTISLGAVAIADANPNVVWVGTGEANNQRSSSWGDGVYKSEDGGKSWRHMGLEGSRHVGAIAIDPRDDDVVFVAALGSLWGSGGERGLFKSIDGGATWRRVLQVDEHTGVVDVVMDPRDPDRLFAAAYQRQRRNWSFVGGGPGSGVYRSEDGGETWERLQNGLPDGDIGKIGFAVSPSRPDTVYAIVQAQERDRTGVYVSHDRGASWERRNALDPTPWYYSQIRVDPQDAERVYVLGTRLSVSDDGGRTFRNDGAAGIHVDHHALWIDPDDPTHMIVGNDGGLAFTYDRGVSWDFAPNLPVTQFYHIAVDSRRPFYTVCGGTQDNNTWCGPAGTRNADGIVNDDWYVTVGGDGFYAQVDPTDPTIVYSESQYGGLVRFDTRTGERKRIQPQPPAGEHYRWNWSAPLLISPHDPATIYFAANKVFRSRNRGDDWEVVSDDLTRQLDRDELPLMGRKWPRNAVSRHAGVSEYGNITTLDESPLQAGLLAAGTDDGLIQISEDAGATWRRIDRLDGVPERTRVSRLAWSRHAPGRLYVAFDAHKDNDFRPYVYVTEDRGNSWRTITSNLPEFGSTRVLREHPRNPDLLAVGTEFGVFVSIDRGEQWVPLQNNLPTVAVHDIVFHPQANDLVIGTHGRGIWILDDIAILEEMAEALAAPVYLASVRPALQFNPFDRGRGSQGARYYRAANPPRGAILTYLVAATGEDDRATPRLEILDPTGRRVRKLQAPSGPGVQRVVWDLRHEPPFEPEGAQRGGGLFGGAPRGPFVLPGSYTVRLRMGDAAVERTVEVNADPLTALADDALHARHDALVRLSDLLARAHAARTAAAEFQQRLQAAERALARADLPDETLSERARDLLRRVREAITQLEGPRGFPPEPGVPAGIQSSARRLAANIDGYTAAPSASDMEAIAALEERLGAVVGQLDELLERELPAFGHALDEAGVPWSPGRPLGGAGHGGVRGPNEDAAAGGSAVSAGRGG